MLPLASTANKEAIRQKWDRPIISAFSKALHKERLDYFGLPGPDIRDFYDWKDKLAWKTGVQILTSGKAAEGQLRSINKMQSNVMLGGFSDKWELRKGLLEDIIIDGTDIDGNRPALLLAEKGRAGRMTYDLHNWDFQGGLGYKSQTGESKRVEAIKRCISLQKTHPFLFLLTLNVRHTLGDELSSYLNGAAEEFSSKKHNKLLDWYSKQTSNNNAEHYRIKAVVPLFVRQIAHINSFDCRVYPPIYYEGWKEHLLHFTFALIPTGTVLPSFSKQKLGDVIDLPLLEAKGGKFHFADIQHPQFNKEQGLNTMKQLNLSVQGIK